MAYMISFIRSVIICYIFCNTLVLTAQNNLFEAPDLTCVKRTTSTDITLEWKLPTISNCFSAYEIYYSVNASNGTYTLLTSISNSLQNNITIANPIPSQTIYFYMIQRGTCTNTNTTTVRFSDTLDNRLSHEYVRIKNISVVNNQVQLTWYEDTYKDVIGYIIYRKTPFVFQNMILDTVYGNSTNTYIDNSINVASEQASYQIKVLLGCGNTGNAALTPDGDDPNLGANNNKVHISSVVNLVNTDICSKTASINWKSYIYENSNVLNYEIQTKDDIGIYYTLATVNNQTTSYILQNIPANQTIAVRLKINLPNNTSCYSNEINFVSKTESPVVNDYIRNITVIDNRILIEYVIDTLAATQTETKLQISPSQNNFVNTTSTSVTQNDYIINYNDGSGNPNNQLYAYSILNTSNCNVTHYSDTATSIHLNLAEKTGNKAELKWNPFSIVNTDFINYTIYKVSSYQNSSDTILLTTINNDITASFIDETLFNFDNDSIQQICYWVIANYYHLQDALPRSILESVSNVKCIAPTPKFFIPNAFAPEGHNKTIKPFIIYSIEEGFQFTIFNRWNQVVFTTNDITASWDGTYLEKPAPMDSYVFVINFKGKDGKDYSEKGTFLLLR